MENSPTEFRACPHCGGRLVAGATICLHCNEEVSAQADDSDGALRRFFVTAFVLFAVLGAVAVVVVQAIGGLAEDKIPKPKTFDEEPVNEFVCVNEDAADQIGALQARGLREVHNGEAGKRCFTE